MLTWYRRPLAGALIVMMTTLAACSTSTSTSESRTPASQSPGPALVVERFLRAANANDLTTMTELFGTAEQSIRELDGQARSEERMYVLASVLRHQDWSIQGQEAVPGRMLDATELQVMIEKEEKSAVVPFLVVRRHQGGWIIERINIEPLTTTEG